MTNLTFLFEIFSGKKNLFSETTETDILHFRSNDVAVVPELLLVMFAESSRGSERGRLKGEDNEEA